MKFWSIAFVVLFYVTAAATMEADDSPILNGATSVSGVPVTTQRIPVTP